MESRGSGVASGAIPPIPPRPVRSTLARALSPPPPDASAPQPPPPPPPAAPRPRPTRRPPTTSDNIHSFDDDDQEDDAVNDDMADEGTLVEHEHEHEHEAEHANGEAARSASPLPPVGAMSPGTAARRIRFRTITLTSTGGYSERILSLDPTRHDLVLQPLDGMQSRAAPGAVASLEHALWLNGATGAHSSDRQADAEQRFSLGSIATVMCFDDALASPSAALIASGSMSPAAFSARALIIFHQDLRQRPHELLFQDLTQRNIFVAVLGELYGIEIVPADDPALTSPGMLGPRSSAHSQLPFVKWIPDSDVSHCMLCSAAFTIMFRKHHCRSCGGIFCGPCSNQTASLPDLGHTKPQRVCANCFSVICEVRKQGLMLSGAGAVLGLNVGGVPLSHEEAAKAAHEPTQHNQILRNKRHSVCGPLDDTAANVVQRPQFLRHATLPRNFNASVSAAQQSSGAAMNSAPSAGTPATPADPPRDIYGFLLSSPTLALVAASNTQRDNTVLYLSSAPSGSPTSADQQTFTTHAAAHESDHGNSTLPPPSSSSTTMQDAANGPDAAAAAAATAAFQASLLAAQHARLALQEGEIDAARARWNQYLAKNTTIDRNSSELRRLVRRGIPPELRGQIWQILSGSRDRQAALQSAHARRFHAQMQGHTTAAEHAHAASSSGATATAATAPITEGNYYSHCLACSQSPQHLSISVAEIEKDLHRTFPDNQLYETRVPHSGVSGQAAAAASSHPKSAAAKAALTSPGLSMLRRVLLAYSFHNPAVGYAQSMNFLCALLLLFMDEEEAFYMLIVLLEDICCIEVAEGSGAGAGAGSGSAGSASDPRRLFYHSPDLAGAHIDQKVYADLVAEKLPRLSAHFERLSFPLAPLTMSWLLCLFVNTLPLETTLVIWDVLMSEGVKILFRASLTLLKVHEKQILKCADFEETLITLKSCSAFHPTLATVPASYAAAAAGGATGNGDGGGGSSGSSAAGGVPTLIPPAIDTAGFMRICFDPLFIGSFPLSKIQALRNFHCLEVEAELAARRLKMRANKEKIRANRLEQQAAAAAAAAASSSSSSGHSSSSRAPSRSPALKSTSACVDPSVEFTLTSSPPRASFLDPMFSSRIAMFETVAHSHAAAEAEGAILDYYASPPAVNSAAAAAAAGAADDREYVPIMAPPHQGGSPRVGPPIRLDSDESHAQQTHPLAQGAASDSSATNATNANANAHSASSPVTAARPARPSFNTVKRAIKRASLVPVQPTATTADHQQGDSLDDAPARPAANASSMAPAPPPPPPARRPSVSGSSGTSPQPAGSPAPSGSGPSGMLSSMFNSMLRALTEDERLMEQRRQEQAAKREKDARANRPTQTQRHNQASGSPQQGRPMQGFTPPTAGLEHALPTSGTPPRRPHAMPSQLTQPHPQPTHAPHP